MEAVHDGVDGLRFSVWAVTSRNGAVSCEMSAAHASGKSGAAAVNVNALFWRSAQSTESVSRIHVRRTAKRSHDGQVCSCYRAMQALVRVVGVRARQSRARPQRARPVV